MIEHLLAKNVEVHLLHLRSPETLERSNNKAFYYPFLSQVPPFKNGSPVVASYQEDVELSDYVRAHNINNIFSLSSRSSYHASFSDITWHALQHGIDTLGENGFDSDHLYIYTRAWVDESRLLVPKYTEIHEVGLYHLGPIATREEILAKYGLPRDRKFLFFAPLPGSSGSEYFFLGHNRFDRWLLNRRLIAHEKMLLAQMSKILKAEGWELIIKSRFKRFLDPSYAECGHVFYDETFFPSTVNELISISEAVVCNLMFSALCTEALELAKPYYVVHHPQHDRQLIPYLDRQIPKLFNPGGESDCVSATDLDWIAKLIRGQLPKQPHARYLNHYLRPPHSQGLAAFSSHLK